MRNIISEKDN